MVKSELNCTPLTVVIVFGVPNLAKIWGKKFTTSREVMVDSL